MVWMGMVSFLLKQGELLVPSDIVIANGFRLVLKGHHRTEINL